MSRLVSNGMSCIFNTHYPAHTLQRANKALLLSRKGDYVFGDVNSVVTEQNIELAFGVKAVISEIETPSNILQDVVPLRVANQRPAKVKPWCIRTVRRSKRVVVISIIASDYNMAQKINELLHEYSSYVIGRMGMPYPKCGVFIPQCYP